MDREKIFQIAAAVLVISSVVCTIFQYIWVYPLTLVGTGIYIVIYAKAGLVGESLINVYYCIMSIYGWIEWSRKKDDHGRVTARRASPEELKISVLLFLACIFLVIGAYTASGTAIVKLDVVTTAIFMVAMYLMAQRALESWYLWLAGDLINVVKLFKVGLYYACAQVAFQSIMAFFGYFEWMRRLEDDDPSEEA